jgi:tetratricopeptide (TPR) repeat protein
MMSGLRLVVSALLCLTAALPLAATSRVQELPEAQNQAVREAVAALFRFDPDAADVIVSAHPDLPPALAGLMKGWIAHQRGEDEKVIEILKPLSVEALPADPLLRSRYEEMLASARQFVHAQIRETRHFRIRVPEPKDEVLVELLDDVLEAAYETYAKIFEFQQSERVLVEIMPSYQLFSQACALTKEQIQTTGTVALCVENRLVILSPRKILQGYEWPHVVAHELVHYVLTKVSRNELPLWFQEGTAKVLERLWEQGHPQALDRHLESALARGLAQQRFVSFEEMHPSFAALPTPELAQLAYAQSASMVDFLQQSHPRAIPWLTREAAKTGDFEQSLAQLVQREIQAWIEDWRQWAAAQDYRDHQVATATLTVLDEDRTPEALSAARDETDEMVLKHRRLGDALLEKERHDAALKQYQKSVARLEALQRPLDRSLVLRLLTGLRRQQRFEEMLTLLSEGHVPLTHDMTLLKMRAAARLSLDQRDGALSDLRQALSLNPFDRELIQLAIHGQVPADALGFGVPLDTVLSWLRTDTPTEEENHP